MSSHCFFLDVVPLFNLAARRRRPRPPPSRSRPSCALSQSFRAFPFPLPMPRPPSARSARRLKPQPVSGLSPSQVFNCSRTSAKLIYPFFSYPVNSQVLDVAGEGDVASDRCGVVRNTTRELWQQSFRWGKRGRCLRVSTLDTLLKF